MGKCFLHSRCSELLQFLCFPFLLQPLISNFPEYASDIPPNNHLLFITKTGVHGFATKESYAAFESMTYAAFESMSMHINGPSNNFF